MTIEGPLPQSGDQQDIGADAEGCLNARKPANWKLQSLAGTDDYGLDYQVQTTPGQRATDIFRVQLKGTRSPDRSADSQFISIQFKATTVRYYARLVEPILLVVCDLSVDPDPVECPLYYVWVRDELQRILPIDPEQKYVTFRVSIKNRLQRTTDLSSDIDAQNELARAGHALGLSVEQTHPGMRIEERVGMTRQVASGMVSRSASFIDALAAPAEQHWIDPAPGTLAWRLRAADRLLKTSALGRAATELDAAEAMLTNATKLEISDYWFLRGKWHTATGSDSSASDSFKKAFECSFQGRYVSAYVEAELRGRYKGEGPEPYPELIALLTGDDPFVLSAKSRVLAAEGNLAESIEVADRLPDGERHAASALAYTMFSKPTEALEHCDFGLALSNLPDNTKQLLLLLRARAKFSIAQADVRLPSDELLPPSGAAGINPSLVKDAWDAIQDAVDVLRDAGWSSNIDHLADIWGGTASILGKQKILLPELAAVAKLRPHLPNLQGALESVAAQCGEFDIALEANNRMPESQTRDLRRTLLLHEAQKHTACFRWFDARFDSFDRGHTLFGPAATLAALSAHKLSEPELVKKWSTELESRPDLTEHAALLHYYMAIELSKLGNEAALNELTKRFDELGRPFILAVALLQELDPTMEWQANLCVQVAKRVQEHVEPSPGMATHVGLALVTLKNWDALLDWCEKFKIRVDAGPRMQAFEALAMDQLGRTPEARAVLERMLAGGVLDSLALNTYIAIMVRCGYVQEAIDVAEKIMEAATSKRQRIDCVRLLFNLIQQSEPGSKRLVALATQMGSLADSNIEVEEGIYLVMFLMATNHEGNLPAPSAIDDYRHRAETYFAKFPNSSILKRAEVREDASGQEILNQLKAIAGVSEDREMFQRRMENQMQQGMTVAPFAWRPRLILSSVSDVIQLWEIAKTSSVDDKKYHLTMLTNREWVPSSASSLRERTPLLDLVTLLVVFDLGLINVVTQFFGKVAIAKATLETLAALVNPFSGSPFGSKCLALQDALKPFLKSIEQPSISDLDDAGSEDGESNDSEDFMLGREQNEVTRLCRKNEKYRLYSDDFAFRIWVARSEKPDGICTLDVLSGLEEAGLLTRQEAARKVAALCGWRVGLVVRFEELIALIPPELGKASDVKRGIEILSGQTEFMAVITALWDYRAPFDKALDHAAAVIARLAEETTLSNEALASILGHWFVKAGLKSDAPPSALGVLTKAITRVAMIVTPSKAIAAKLWSVFRQIVQFHHAALMDEKKEREAIVLLGAECAKLQLSNPGAGQAAQLSLRLGLTEETSDDAAFMAGYTDTLVRLGARARPS